MGFKQKIEDRTAVVGIIGLGYVGLPLANAFSSAGFKTLGFDVDPKKIEDLAAGRDYLQHLGEGFVGQLKEGGRFSATTDFERLSEPDAILICVPTPLGVHQEPDLSYVNRTTDSIAAILRRGQLIVLESTTYPSTTRGLLSRLEANGLVCGRDFFLAFSPEREDPGRGDYTTQMIPKLVGGVEPSSGRLAAELYRVAFEQVVEVSSAEVAESAKLLENIYRAVNIALVNEMKILLQEMEIDVWEVIDAAATKPFGFQAFYPGPGLGGHCIPIDPFYLTWKAREVGLPTKFIELAGQVNHSMPDYVIQRTVWAMNQQGLSLKGSRVLVLGLAYKPNVGDVRESPAIELIEKLQNLEANVEYHDPHVPQTHKMRQHDLKMVSIDLDYERLGDYDCVLIATNHSAYKWQSIADHATLVVDTRGAMRWVNGKRAHIFRA